MSPDVSGSPTRRKKITLADFIHEKRANPSVNLSLRSRPLTPQSHLTSVNGSTNELDNKSSNTDKPISSPSNRRDSSRTHVSDEEEDDEEEENTENKSRRKRAVFACDGHGKRESFWKLESIRRMRLSNIIQKSRESSAKTAGVSEVDLFNDSRSGYSFDIISRQSTRHPPHSRESKRSRRDRKSRGDNRHTPHSYRGFDVHRSVQKGTQTMGESRGCQTSPTMYNRIDEGQPVIKEANLQPPITEVEDEFDYPLSQLLLEYPYKPKQTETRTTESATEPLSTETQEVQKSQTIDIDIRSSHDGGKQIYDANGTIIIVTASPRIDPGDRENNTDISDNNHHVDPEQKNPDKVNDKHISNDHFTYNKSSQDRNHSEHTGKAKQPADVSEDSNRIVTSNTNTPSKANMVLPPGTSGDKVPTSHVDSLKQNHDDRGTEHMDEDRNMTSNGTDELVKDNESSTATEEHTETGKATTLMDEGGNMNSHVIVTPGTDNVRTSITKSGVESSSDINQNTDPTTDRNNGAQPPLGEDNSGRNLQEKAAIVEKDEKAESGIQEIIRSKAISSKNISDEQTTDKNTSVDASSRYNNNDTEVSDKHCDKASLGQETSTEDSEIHTSVQGKQETHEDIHRDQQRRSCDTDRQERGMNMDKKGKNGKSSRQDRSLLDACKREISDEVQLGKAVLKVIQMWKDSDVVRSLKDQESDGATSAPMEDETSKKGDSSSSDRRSMKSSESERTSRAQITAGKMPSSGKEDTNNVLKTSTTAQPKQIQIVIRNPLRNSNSNKASSVKIVIKLPSESQQNSITSTADVAEEEVSKLNKDDEENNKHEDIQSVEIPKAEPQEVPSQESQEIQNAEPQDIPTQTPLEEPQDVPRQANVTPEKEISDTRVPLPPISKLVPSEANRHFKRLSHVTSGKRRSQLISLRQATVTTASIRMREVDGVFCSNRGVYIGHDRKLYNSFQDASETTRVDRILENFKEMRNGNIGKAEFVYDETNDDIFQAHLNSFRRGNSQKSRVTGSVVLATSKMYSQARTRKARAYSILHKKLTSAVNY